MGGLFIAAAVHGGALALALLAARTPPLEVIQIVEGPPHVYQPRPGPGTTATLVKPPRGHPPTHAPRQPRTPRNPPAPVELAPAPPAPAPEASELPTPIAANPSPAGAGVGLDTPTSGQGGGCPEGQVCPATGAGATEEVVTFTPDQMDRPRPHCEPPAPRSPAEAAQLGLEGTVMTLFVVYADGHVGSVRVVNPDAPPVFARAVRDWLEGCTFTAARYQGHEVSVRMQQTFRFKSR